MELAPRHLHHPKEIGVPELLGRSRITVPELDHPHVNGGKNAHEKNDLRYRHTLGDPTKKKTLTTYDRGKSNGG
jgi:hypothetical protein